MNNQLKKKIFYGRAALQILWRTVRLQFLRPAVSLLFLLQLCSQPYGYTSTENSLEVSQEYAVSDEQQQSEAQPATEIHELMEEANICIKTRSFEADGEVLQISDEPAQADTICEIQRNIADQGKHQTGQDYPKTAEETLNTYSFNPVEYAQSLIEEAEILNTLCCFPEAKHLVHEAMEILKDCPEHRDLYASALISAARTQSYIGDFKKAVELLENSVEILSKIEEHGYFYGEAQLHLAEIYRTHKEYDKALESLEVSEKTLAHEENPGYFEYQIKYARGECLFGKEDYSRALTEIDEALKLAERYNEDQQTRAAFYLLRAKVLAGLQEYDEAFEALSLDFLKKMFPEYPALEKDHKLITAFIHFQKKDLEKTQEFLLSAHELLYEHYMPNLPKLSESDKAQFISEHWLIPDSLYTLSFHHLNPGKAGLEAVLMHKGLVESVLQNEQQFLHRGFYEDSEIPNLYETMMELRQQKASDVLDADYSEESGCPERTNHAKERLVAELDSELARKRQPHAEKMLPPRIGFEKVKEIFRDHSPGAVLLEYVKYRPERFDNITHFLNTQSDKESEEERYGVFIVHPGFADPLAIDLGPAQDIVEKVGAFRSAVNDSFKSKILRNTKKCADTAIEVRRLIFDPLTPYLRDRTRLFIVPDAELFLLPFEALPSTHSYELPCSYLLGDYEIIYLNSGRELLRLTDERKVEKHRKTATVISDPDLYMKDSERAEILVNWYNGKERAQPTNSIKPGARVSQSLRLGLSSLGPIPDAAKFIQNVFTTERFSSLNKWEGRYALEDKLFQCEAPQVLQILSHGISLEDYNRLLAQVTPHSERGLLDSVENPLFRSFLALAGASVSTSEVIYCQNSCYFTREQWQALPPEEKGEDFREIAINDGCLTAYEVSGLNLLNTEIVSLAACNTAIGDVARGANVAGLRHAFTIAGAKSMIMSQWKIPMEHTIEQMENFYLFWLDEGMGRYEAFRESQLIALEEARDCYGGHPKFWAGLIYIGDPGPASGNTERE